MRIILGIFIFFIISGCERNSDLPASQIELIEKLQTLKDSIQNSKNNGNELTLRQAENEFENFIAEPNSKADLWIGTVDSVAQGDIFKIVDNSGYGNGVLFTEVESATITLMDKAAKYELELFTPEAIKFASSINKGEQIIFSGILRKDYRSGTYETIYDLIPDVIKSETTGKFVEQSKAKLQSHFEKIIENESISICESAARKTRIRKDDFMEILSTKGPIKKPTKNEWTTSIIYNAPGRYEVVKIITECDISFDVKQGEPQLSIKYTSELPRY